MAVVLSLLLLVIYCGGISLILLYTYYQNTLLGICLSIPALILLYEPVVKFIRYAYYTIIGKPALIILKDKLVDNINNEIFYWADVDQIGFRNQGKLTGYIFIRLKDALSFIDETTNPYMRIIRKLNNKYWGTPIVIQPNIIRCKKNELYKQIVNAHLGLETKTK